MMFQWLRRIFDRRCEFYDTCDLKRDENAICNTGPTYFDGLDTRAYCGHYRTLAGWSKPDIDNSKA